MDGTFKSCPKSFYQIYNIIGKDKKTGMIIPLIFILMSHKSYDSYFYVFDFIQKLLKKEKIELDIKNIFFMLDFEKASRRALKTIFPDSRILGCYFHYVKALWSKAKKEGLTKKNIIFDTYILIFAFKMFQFIQQNKKGEFIEEIKKLYSEKKQYEKFISYFERNWRHCNFLNLAVLEQEEIDERTDNQCEIFHRKLNQIINNPHPKVSKLIEKIKEYSIEQFHILAENIILNVESKNNDINIYTDIFKFVKNLKVKYKKELSLNLLKNLNKEEKDKIKEISIGIIKEIMNIEINDESNENNEDIEILSDEEDSEDKEGNEIKEENNIEEKKDENNNEDEENNNLFDIEKKIKNIIKKMEKTDFYEINEDLYMLKQLKRKKKK